MAVILTDKQVDGIREALETCLPYVEFSVTRAREEGGVNVHIMSGPLQAPVMTTNRIWSYTDVDDVFDPYWAWLLTMVRKILDMPWKDIQNDTYYRHITIGDMTGYEQSWTKCIDWVEAQRYTEREYMGIRAWNELEK